MNKPIIKTNLALEFIYNLIGIAYYEINKTSDENFSTQRFNHFINEYIESIYYQIPIMVRNDIQLFLKDFSCFYIVLLDLCFTDDIDQPTDLINYLKGLTTQEMLNLYIERIDTPMKTDIDSPQLDQFLDELTSLRHELALDKELFYEFSQFPIGIMERMTQAFEFYYTNFFQPKEADLKTQIKLLIQRHTALYNSNPQAFINAILFQSKESLNEDHTQIYIYPGYYYGDKISVAYGNEGQIYFMYGAAAEKNLYSEDHKAQYEELIKSLADDTRRNLIRYLMNSPHYNREISDYLGITTATISYHISRLVDLGIIHLKYQEGKRIYYQVDRERFDQLFDGMKRFLYSDPS